MICEDEVLRRFPNFENLSHTVNAVSDRLRRVAMLAAADRASELIDFAKACERVRRQSVQPEPPKSPADDNASKSAADVTETADQELPVATSDKAIPEPSAPAIDLYDPQAARKQLDSYLPQNETALESLLEAMVSPGVARRPLAVPEPGMAQACCTLMTELPNLAAVVELIAGAVSLAERHQLPIQLPRLHLDGTPGCGKTQLLRRVAEVLNLPLVVITMSALHGNFELVGCNRVYRGAEPGRLIKSLLNLDIGNPIFLFDEAELGHPQHYGPLLSFLEDDWFTDTFFEMPFRTEYVNKVFITNDATFLSPAIRSRLHCIEVQQPTPDEMRMILQRLYANLRTAKPQFGKFPETLDPELGEALLSEPLRGARTLLEAAMYRAACRQQDAAELRLALGDFAQKPKRPSYQFSAGHA